MSLIAQKPIIPWKRFWCRFGETIHLGDDGRGFLTDPEGDLTKLCNPNLMTLDQLLNRSCLILCGDPGSGKTTVLGQGKNALKNSLGEGGDIILLEFRDVPNESVFAKRTFDSPAWQRWRSSAGKLVLIVDGVDEGLVRVPGFISYLAAQLRQEEIGRLQIVLVCRSAEWPVSEGQRLISLWGESQNSLVLELCPLRQCDAELAAEKWGLDKRAFIQAVYRQKVVGLAALPATLFFLLAEFRESGGFVRTHRELYERGCMRLSRELDPRRTETLRALRKSARVSTPEEVYEAASRLAVLFLLCGKSAIYSGPLDEIDARSDLHISGAADADLTEDLILDTIESGLFTSRGSNRSVSCF